MKHQRIQKHISAYLDDELTPELRSKIDNHLHSCQECTEMLSSFRQNRQMIAALQQPTPSIKHVVLARIRDANTTSWEKFVHVFKRWVFRPFTVGTTAFSTICIIVAFYFLTYSPAPQYDELLDFYYGIHTEEVANNPLKSNIAIPISDTTTYIEENGDNTEEFLILYLGE